MRLGLLRGGVLLAAMLAAGAAAAFCRLPDDTRAEGPAGRRLYGDGAALCIRRAGPDCVGCANGFVHECRHGDWLPRPDRPCGLDGRGGRFEPQDEVPFRHCRYFDRDGVELRVAPEHVRSAQETGLVAAQRCETVWCRFYDRFGEPVPYAPQEAERIGEDLRSGALALGSTECRRGPARADPRFDEGR